MSVEEVRLARVALGWLAEPGNLKVWRRVAQLGAVRVLDELLAKGMAAEVPDDPRRLAEQALARGRRLGARVVVPEDAEWPAQLDQLITICDEDSKVLVDRDAAPPLCLWVRGVGRLDEVLDRSVAVVGSRAATAYGGEVARRLGYGLAGKDWTVVSGGAYGVDAYAHRGTLAGGGITVVVLACGVDRAYPVAHANLFDRVAEDGMVVSEWPPGAEPFRFRFLIRNRVIAAMTRGTVVVEAAARSGALHTFRRARQLNRHLMAVPGPVTSAMSVGCHQQLREPDVQLVTGVGQVVELVGELGADAAPVPRGPQRQRDRLDPVEARLVDALFVRKPQRTEEVAGRAKVPVREAMRLLPSLVYRGFAVEQGHGFILAPALIPLAPEEQP